MPKRLTEEEINARCEAYENAALSLELDWTDNPVERAQGNIVAEQLRKLSDKFYRETYRNGYGLKGE